MTPYLTTHNRPVEAIAVQLAKWIGSQIKQSGCSITGGKINGHS